MWKNSLSLSELTSGLHVTPYGVLELNIDSYNGLVPHSTKPSLEPVLTNMIFYGIHLKR